MWKRLSTFSVFGFSPTLFFGEGKNRRRRGGGRGGRRRELGSLGGGDVGKVFFFFVLLNLQSTLLYIRSLPLVSLI